MITYGEVLRKLKLQRSDNGKIREDEIDYEASNIYYVYHHCYNRESSKK